MKKTGSIIVILFLSSVLIILCTVRYASSRGQDIGAVLKKDFLEPTKSEDKVSSVEEIPVEATSEVIEVTPEPTPVIIPDMVKGAVSYVDADIENPAHIGEWVKLWKSNMVDGGYSECYFSVAEITKDPETIKTYIDSYNEGDGIYHITDEPEDPDLEYILLVYRFYYPSNYNSTGSPIKNAAVTDFDVIKMNDVNWIVGEQEYQFKPGWISLTDLSENSTNIEPGMYYQGIILYTMLKGYTGSYGFSEVSTPSDMAMVKFYFTVDPVQEELEEVEEVTDNTDC